MGNFTAVPDVANNQSFPPSLWESAIMNNLNLGVCRQLADTTLVADAASITLGSIPQTFAHLILVTYARDDGVGTGTNLLALQFNGDTAANYDSNGINTAGINGQTAAKVGMVAAGAKPANLFAASYILIPHYAQTLNKKQIVAIASDRNSTAPNPDVFGGTWHSLTAITQILMQSSVGGNLKSGSRATLYGLPA